ncbi:MAG: STAS domain-containing protein [Lachnospiraceae bacterium]|nr:STAS domain-containing protein [Lachnospiraceae bacterium]
MYIEEIQSEGALQLNVEGKLDSITSQEFQNDLLRAFQKSNSIIINMDKVEYTSSAALRALTLGHKTAIAKGGRMTLVNVKPAVMDVFKMTGFDKMLNIE